MKSNLAGVAWTVVILVLLSFTPLIVINPSWNGLVIATVVALIIPALWGISSLARKRPKDKKGDTTR